MRIFRLLLAVAIVFTMTSLYAANSKKAAKQKELEQRKQTYNLIFDYAKKNIEPLFKCFAQNQPHFQFADYNYPNKLDPFKDNLNACAAKHDQFLEVEPKAVELKDKLIKLCKTASSDAGRYQKVMIKYSKAEEKLAKDPDNDDVKKEKAELSTKITGFKKLFNGQALEYNKIKKEYVSWMEEVKKKYLPTAQEQKYLPAQKK